MSKDNIYQFGRKLLAANDLDPVYAILWQAKLDDETLRRWLLAYWCFYHVGTASAITDSAEYWETMRQAAKSKEWPRCPERRHFRGQNAINSVDYLASCGINLLFTPFLCEVGETLPLEQVMGWVQTWVGFGPWIAFKVADMLERLEISKIDFGRSSVFMFESPVEGAQMMWNAEFPHVAKISNPSASAWALMRLEKHFSDVKAPPRNDRTIGPQEIETILCKWKSYMNGKYHIGEDVEGCRKALNRFPNSEIANTLVVAGRRAGLWNA